MWVFLAILTGVLFGIQSVLIKRLTAWFPQTILLQYLFLIASFILLPFVLTTPFSLHSARFFTAFFVSLLINITAYSLLFYAIRLSPVSLIMPYLGFTPLFITLSAYFILGETVSFWQVIGISGILLGGFILQIPDKREADQGIFRFLNFKEKGIGLVLIVAFLWSISASVEKIAVQSSSVFFYAFTIHLALGLSFYLIGRPRNRKKLKEQQTFRLIDQPNKKKFFLFGLGLVSGLLAYTQLSAILLTNVSMVIAFKRAGIVVSSLGGIFYLKEPGSGRILFGTLLVLLGASIVSMG